MSEDLAAALEHYLDHAGKDEETAHEIYHDDAVLEFPQSGERCEGVENFKEWRTRYPADVAYRVRLVTTENNLFVGEISLSYDGGPWMFGVSLMEFREGKVTRERIYVMEGWEAADWRAPWRSDTPADPPFD